MTIGFKKLLLLIAVVVFILAAGNVWNGSLGTIHVDLVAVGLAFFAGSFLAS